MSDEGESGRQWIVDPPPGPGEVSLYVVCGYGADLRRPEQEAALSETVPAPSKPVTPRSWATARTAPN